MGGLEVTGGRVLAAAFLRALPSANVPRHWLVANASSLISLQAMPAARRLVDLRHLK